MPSRKQAIRVRTSQLNRAAYREAMIQDGHKSMSAWLNRLAQQRCAELDIPTEPDTPWGDPNRLPHINRDLKPKPDTPSSI